MRIVDAAGTTLEVETTGWEPSDQPSVERAVEGRIDGPEEFDAVQSGRAQQIAFPGVHLAVLSLSTGERWGVHPPTSEQTALSSDSYLVAVDASVKSYLRIEGGFTIRSNTDCVRLTFDEPTGVSMGFESSVARPNGRIVVPETPAGVAHALTTLAATPEVTAATRSWPSLRPHPPVVEFGEERRTEGVRTHGTSDVVVRLPPDPGRLVSAAGLVYYLGATVELQRGVEPTIVADGTRLSLDTAEGFDSRTNRLLRRAVWLDCLVRSADDYGIPVRSAARLADLPLDPERLVDASVGTRLRRYTTADLDGLVGELPDWHLSVRLPAELTAIRIVPRLFGELPFVETDTVVRPVERPAPLSGGDAPQVSGETATRSGPAASTRSTADSTAWFGGHVSGTAGEGFELLPAALANRDRYAESDETLSFLTVINDEALAEGAREEGTRAAREYAARDERLAHNVTVRENLTTAELARAFETGVDLLHFVGHHDDGLSCVDGALDAASLSASNARTFLLNACDSAKQGRELIRRGSVAGGVTRRAVIDETAVRFGTTFAGLVCGGFPVVQAVSFASEQTLSPEDYYVVGDGTHIVTQNTGPAVAARIDSTDEGFELRRRYARFGFVGSQSVGQLDDEPTLGGAMQPVTLDRDELREWLGPVVVPVLFDGAFYAPDELREQL